MLDGIALADRELWAPIITLPGALVMTILVEMGGGYKAGAVEDFRSKGLLFERDRPLCSPLWDSDLTGCGNDGHASSGRDVPSLSLTVEVPSGAGGQPAVAWG